MGVASKAAWIILRCLQLIFAVVVVGLDGRYMRLASEFHASTNSYLIYTQVIAVLSVILALVLCFPWSGAFYAFPLDFIMWILWMIAFGLQVHLAGGVHCNSVWYWHNWGWFWGRPVGPFPVNFTQVDVGRNGCGAMQTVWAFSFISGWMFFLGGIVGAYCFVHRDGRRDGLTGSAVRDGNTESMSENDAGHTKLNGINNFNSETGERI